jgi:hypothetical protein
LVAEDVIGMVASLKSKAQVPARRSRPAHDADARFPRVEPGQVASAHKLGSR